MIHALDGFLKFKFVDERRHTYTIQNLTEACILIAQSAAILKRRTSCLLVGLQMMTNALSMNNVLVGTHVFFMWLGRFSAR